MVFIKKQPFKHNLISNLHGLEMYQFANNKIEYLKKLILKIPSNTIIKKSRYTVSLGGKLESILLKNGANRQSIFKLPNAIESSWIIKKLSNERLDKLKFVLLVGMKKEKV